MAKKKEPNFNADKFLEEYEESTSAVPTASLPQEKSPENSVAADSASKPLSDRELEYMQTFILQNRYGKISRKGKQVTVSEEFKKKIQKLMLFFSEGGSITEYVNNVLHRHFEEYDDVINRMFNNSIKL